MAVSPIRSTEGFLQGSNVSLRQQLTTRIQNATHLTRELAESIVAYAERHWGDEEWLDSFQTYGGTMRPFPHRMTVWRQFVKDSTMLMGQSTQGGSVVREQPVTSVHLSLITHIQETTRIPSTLVDMISDYAIACFGALEWRQYFHQDIGSVPGLPEHFFTFWNGPDPMKPMQRVCDTHLPPVFRPALLTDCTTRATRPWHLNELAKLVLDLPTGLRQMRCHVQFETLPSQSGMTAGAAAWIVMRKGVTGKNMHPASIVEFVEILNRYTQAGYERLPASDDLATVVLTRYLTTGERHLGDGTGVEGRPTYGCTIEHVNTPYGTYHRAVGNFGPSFISRRASLNLDSFGGLDLSFFGMMEKAHFGSVLLRRF